MKVKKTVAFDIDGTLFYTTRKILEDSIEVEINSQKRYLKIRPNIEFLFEYLDLNKDFFEIIIYSAATNEYIETLLNFVDKKHLIQKIYDREYCDKNIVDGKMTFIKNYKKIKEDLHNLYLIDDNETHFDNLDIIGYKCHKFKGNIDDYEIFNIIEFLETLKIV